jgi:hypothetical protein
MAEEHLNTEKMDVQSELDKIKALGRSIGSLMIDETDIPPQDVGELGYLVFHLVEQVEKKLNGRSETMEPKVASLPGEGNAPAQDAAGVVPEPEGKEPKSVEIIRMAGNFMQIGSTHAFVLYQVIEAMRDLNLSEIQELSKAITPFERMARERRFRQVIGDEIGESLWVASFHKKVEDQEAA